MDSYGAGRGRVRRTLIRTAVTSVLVLAPVGGVVAPAFAGAPVLEPEVGVDAAQGKPKKPDSHKPHKDSDSRPSKHGHPRPERPRPPRRNQYNEFNRYNEYNEYNEYNRYDDFDDDDDRSPGIPLLPPTGSGIPQFPSLPIAAP